MAEEAPKTPEEQPQAETPAPETPEAPEAKPAEAAPAEATPAASEPAPAEAPADAVAEAPADKAPVEESAPAETPADPAPAEEPAPAKPAKATSDKPAKAASAKPAKAASAKPAKAAKVAADKAPAKETAEEATPAEGEAEAEAEAPVVDATPMAPIPPLPDGTHYIWGTGRRKKAVARVRIRPGTGKFLINKRDADEYFKQQRDREAIRLPLSLVKMAGGWDIWVNVGGGGYTGQAGAVVMGLARALCKAAPDVESALRGQGLLTRDARMSERKKPGQPGARKRFQFSKR